MDDAGRLMAIEEIRQLKAAYFRCMDTKDWAPFGDLFEADAQFDARGALEMPKPEADYAAEPIVEGRAAVVAYVSSGLDPLISVHHGHMSEITVLSETEAKAVWPMTDMLIFPPGGPFRKFRGWGYYHETYRKDGRWRILTLRLRRLYVETA